jgi:hypothetical protein
MDRDHLTHQIAVSAIKGTTILTGDNVFNAFKKRSNLIPKIEFGEILMFTIKGGTKYTSQEFRAFPLKDILRGNDHTTTITLTIEDKAEDPNAVPSAFEDKSWEPPQDDNVFEIQEVDCDPEKARVCLEDERKGWIYEDDANKNRRKKKKRKKKKKKKKKKRKPLTSLLYFSFTSLLLLLLQPLQLPLLLLLLPLLILFVSPSCAGS